MKSFDWYKEKFGTGDDEVYFNDNGTLSIPYWLIKFIINKTGLKSKKKRIIKKILKREVSKAISRGLNEVIVQPTK